MAAKGADTVALVFYAGHGLQIDGENFLVPVDVDPKREADIPMQAVRLNDILNTLTSVPSKMRILLLDACRNNPFPDISKTAGGGLAIVDAKVGAPGTFLSFSTSPGAEAEDGNGADSPYTTALLAAAKEPGLPIEETFKRVRVAVNKATEGRQTPWDSSSLTDDFRFSGPAVAGPKLAAATKRTVEEWTRDLKGKPVEAANEMIVADGTDEAYEAFAEAVRANAVRACRRATGSIATAAWWRGTMPSSSTPRRAIARSWRNTPTAISPRPRASWKSGCATVPTSPPWLPAPSALARPTSRWPRPTDQRLVGNAPRRPAAEEGRSAGEEARRSGSAQARRSRAAPRGRRRCRGGSPAAAARSYEPAPGPSIGIGIGIGGGGYGGRGRTATAAKGRAVEGWMLKR